uniref:Monodehydroascorbate reductase n=1 Tax=Tanacetum cinerariifolium TaxID=118510 RepID=A0A699GYM2_TANCI|nr:hypothetical protein [Tanacetum cinerariifolium]
MTMATTIEQQVVLDEALVLSTQRLRIGRSNFRLPSDIQSKESTLQVVYDVLCKCPFFKVFLVTADVPEVYMQEFWATAYVHQYSIRFKMDSKKNTVDLETFRDMLHICPRVPGQSFDELPFEKEILDFLRFLGHSAQIRTLTDVNVNKLFQPWRSFATIINKCLTGKSFGFDSFRLSQAQILWELYHKRNIDYAFLIWEDFVYQVEHKNQKKSNEMYYLRFTKVIIHHFMLKKPSIPRRNKVNWHYVRDDMMFSTIKAYKEYYACATGEAAPKPKASARRKKSGSYTFITPPTAITTPTTTVAVVSRLTDAAKEKQPAKAKSQSDLSEVARTEAEQLKIVLRRSRQETHISQLGSSGIDEGTSSKPGVLDVPFDDSEEEISWNSSDDEDADSQDKDKDDDEGDKKDEKRGGDDDEETKSDEEIDEEETREDDSFDPIPRTSEGSEDDGNDELYRDVDINHGRGLQLSQDIKDSHVTLTSVNPDGQQESSSVSSQFVSSMLNPTSDVGMESIFATALSSVAPLPTPTPTPTMTSSIITTITTASHPPIPPTPIPSLCGAYEADKIILDTYGERVILKRRRDDDDDQGEGHSARSDWGSKRQREGNEPESASALLVLQPGAQAGTEDQPIIQSSQHPEWFSQPKKPPSPDHDWNKTLPAAQGSTQSWISDLAKQADSRSSVNELLDTPLDFSSFIMNRLRIDILTPELLARPTYELMKGLCNSLTELEYHLEEVYKATMYQLDWVNPEGQQYPYNLLQPLMLIPDNRGRRVIPFAHFINNDLEYLRGGDSNQKYTTSVTKTKAADYGHIKWIEDLVPHTMWFYGFAINRESALDVYSKRRIIAVTGDFKRLRLQDIEDMLLLLIQGKLSNLTLEERFAFNVSLRMFTRSIVIQRRVENLQLGVKSYQKRLNLTKPNTYRSDLKRREAYTAYSNPRGFIYQNKDKKNRLMRIDELHKFSDGTLNDVCNALDGRLKGIRMQYLP